MNNQEWNQKALTMPEDERPALKEESYCPAESPEKYACTRVKGHEGKHVAHGENCKIIASWEDLTITPGKILRALPDMGHELYNIVAALRGPDSVPWKSIAALKKWLENAHVDAITETTDQLGSYFTHNPANILKWLTTARVRAVIGFPSHSIMVNPGPISAAQIVLRNKMMVHKDLQHFGDHFEGGIIKLEKLATSSMLKPW